MGYVDSVRVFDNLQEIPGVTAIREFLPGLTVAVTHQAAEQAWEVRNCLQTHLLLFALSPVPLEHKVAVAGLNGGDFVYAGHLNVIPAQTPYRTLTREGQYKLLSLKFDPVRFDQATGIGQGWDPKASCNIHNSELETELWRLARELAAPGFASRALIEGVCLTIMADLARVIKSRECETPHRQGTLSDRQVKLIKEYIEDFEEASPTISELAALIGVSGRYLSKAFKETTGQTVHGHVAAVRMRKAAALLSGTNLPIKEVAARLGFSAFPSFSYAFRTATGHRPTEFRRLFHATGSVI